MDHITARQIVNLADFCLASRFLVTLLKHHLEAVFLDKTGEILLEAFPIIGEPCRIGQPCACTDHHGIGGFQRVF